LDRGIGELAAGEEAHDGAHYKGSRNGHSRKGNFHMNLPPIRPDCAAGGTYIGVEAAPRWRCSLPESGLVDAALSMIRTGIVATTLDRRQRVRFDT
jgi:hypothetical protein